MRVKTEFSMTTKVMNYIRENKLTSFCVDDFLCLGVSTKQAKSILQNLAARGSIYRHGLEDTPRRSRLFYGTSKKPSKAVLAVIKQAKDNKDDEILYFGKYRLSELPKGCVTVHKVGW